MSDPRDKIRRAFDWIYDNHPYGASIVASWHVEAKSDEWFASIGINPPTACTTGPDLFYSAKFIDQLRIREVCDLILHEMMHVLLGHHFRFEGKKPRTWNVAADLALNSYVKEYYDSTGLIYREGLFPGHHPAYYRRPEMQKYWDLEEEKSAEYYFEAVTAQREAEKARRQAEKSNQKAQKQKTSKPKSEFNLPTTPIDPDDYDPDEIEEVTGPGSQTAGTEKENALNSEPTSAGEPQTKSEPPQIGEEKGSPDKAEKTDEQDDSATEGEAARDGSPAESEDLDDESDLPHPAGDVLPHPSTQSGDEEAVDQAKQEWEQQVAEGINNAKAQGNLPGWAEDLVHEYDHAVPINPEVLLRQFMTQYAPTSTSYSKPNRRSAYRTDIVLPAQRARDLSPGVVLMDTSGSMNLSEMNQGLALIERTVRIFPHCTITLKQADTRLIQSAEKVFTLYDFPLRVPHEWYGRGGTNLSPAIKAIGESRKYQWLIVISDMEWNVDQCVDPRIPTLWLITQPLPQAYSKPKFGQVVPLGGKTER